MNKNWSEEEENILGRIEYTDKELASLLGRSLTSVKKKRQRLEIIKKRGRQSKSDDRDELVY